MGTWHAHNLVAQPDIEVVAVADIVDAAAETLAHAVDARVEPAPGIVHCPDIEAILIASSDDTHARFATEAIQVGKPLFLEKPIGGTVDQALMVLDWEVEFGRRITRVGFMRELDPAHVEIRNSLRDLGPITKIRCVHRNVDPSPRPLDKIFVQSLIHDIHTVRWLTGQEFARVTVHKVERPDGFHLVLMVGELAGGALATVEFEDQGFAYEVQVEVTAVGGMVSTLPHPRSVTRRDAAESLMIGTDWFGRFDDAYRLEIEDWARALHRWQPSGPTVWDGYAAQVVAEAGERALLEGRTVDIELPERPALYELYD